MAVFVKHPVPGFYICRNCGHMEEELSGPVPPGDCSQGFMSPEGTSTSTSTDTGTDTGTDTA